MTFEFTKDPVLLAEEYARQYVDDGKDYKKHDPAFRTVPRPYFDVLHKRFESS